MAVTTSGTYDAKSTFDPVKNKVYKRRSKLKRHLLRRTCTLCGRFHSKSCHLDSHVEKKATRRRAALDQNHGLNHSHGPDFMPADGTVQSDGMMPVNSASQHHEEACETSSATQKYIHYLKHFDVSTGMSSIPHTAPEQPHLLCDSAMEVHREAQS